jgi:ATP-dependent Clp protease ATP-binding subunit ClpB
VLFDEIEKAGNVLSSLLFGIIDNATLTLGANRRVDFSRAMLFKTSDLGASEMSALFFRGSASKRHSVKRPTDADEKLTSRTGNCAVYAARRNLTPEYITASTR